MPPAADIVYAALRCKWVISILDTIHSGTRRPGAIQRNISGLSAKVMNERFKKLMQYRILKRVDSGKKALHVEYHLTDFGREFLIVLEAIRKLSKTPVA